MLYHILKFPVSLAIKIFCRHIIINKPAILESKGPLLLACNHPNSFLDGVILATLFKHPVYSLARGDVFRSATHRKLLASLNLLPVYRTSEGVENLGANYETFEECIHIFRESGIVIIFSEGRCINEWHLRPLKKGTARLAMATWSEQLPLTVLPVGINYSSFRRFGKNVILNFGEPIHASDFEQERADGARHNAFNHLLEAQLSGLVFEIDSADKKKQERLLGIRPSISKKILLCLPAIIGLIAHAPLYLPTRVYVLKKTNHSDHYDSVMTAILLFIYPVYLLALIVTISVVLGIGYAMVVLLLPFTAWAYVQWKPQLDK